MTDPETGHEVVTRIGKIDFTVKFSDAPEPRTSSEARVKALVNWLLACWRAEHEEESKVK